MGKTKNPLNQKPRQEPATVPLEELARQQGITPITDVDALGALLPAEHDPDEFAAFIAAERAARRRAAND